MESSVGGEVAESRQRTEIETIRARQAFYIQWCYTIGMTDPCGPEDNWMIVVAIFIKYEFWPNLLNELKKKEIKTILVSGILRKEQLFFKSYGGFMRTSLEAFHHFFVQDSSSKNLLESINCKNISLSGDTRFDRVAKILEQDNSLPYISADLEITWNKSFRGTNLVYGESIYTSRWETFGTYELPTVENIRFQFSANGHHQNSFYHNKYLVVNP